MSINISFSGEIVDDFNILVEHVSVSVPGKELFKDATLKIIKGHCYGLIGPNGHGKTTILRVLHERQIPFSTKISVHLVEQEAEIDKSFLNGTVIESVINSHTKMIDALQEAAILRETCSDIEQLQELERELENMGENTAEAKARKILFGLGFSNSDQERKISTLSGGWRKRVALSCALFMEPDVLLLDEPTNHLDLDAVVWLGNYLSELINKKKKSIMLVSHDVSFLNEICTDIINVENKKLIYYVGDYDQFIINDRLRKATIDKQSRSIKQLENEQRTKGLTKSQIKDKVKERIEKKGWDENILIPRREYRVTFQWEISKCLRNGPILSLKKVNFGYPGDSGKYSTPIFKDLNFSVKNDSRIVLIGKNGCGKSTLIKLLTGELEPITGSRETISGIRIGSYSQHFIDKLPMDKSPVEYLLDSGLDAEFKARAKLGYFGLEGSTHLRAINTLSGGQKARVAFAAISAQFPNILILDEPTNHLDIESIQALIDSLKNFQGAIILVTHDARMIESIDAELWIVRKSNVEKFDGDLDDYKDFILQQ